LNGTCSHLQITVPSSTPEAEMIAAEHGVRLAECRLMDAALYDRSDISTSNIGDCVLGHSGHVDSGF